MKRIASIIFTFFLIIPLTVFAYSSYVIPSGKSIGIELKTDNPLIVGSYNINGHDVLKESELLIGDKIVKINNTVITSSRDVNNIVSNSSQDKIEITYLRNNNLYTKTIPLYIENGKYKTGLYIKDTIRGVATLTYIDFDKNEYGALGHEIVEKSTKNKFDMKNGSIYKSTVTGVTRSYDGSPGEKNAISDSSIKYGNVIENTKSGIFGKYTANIPNLKKYKVATSSDIKLGNAQILTSIEGNNVEKFDINIIRINENSNTKNILFEVTDKKLLEKTGGIVQGMSGSPIIQGEYIVGAVNYVLVDKTDKGYGIFITNMLKEAEN